MNKRRVLDIFVLFSLTIGYRPPPNIYITLLLITINPMPFDIHGNGFLDYNKNKTN